MEINVKPGFLGVVFFFVFATNPAGALAQGTATETIGFEIAVEPVFFVESAPDQQGNVHIGPVLPGKAGASETVRVVVHSNRGQPYRITQQIEQQFHSDRGSEMTPSDVMFTVTVSDGIHGGRSQIQAPIPVGRDRTVIFVSNPQGDPDEFTMTYITRRSKVLPAGSYRGRIQIDGELT